MVLVISVIPVFQESFIWSDSEQVGMTDLLA